MWFIFSLICLFGWGLADIFYKKGSENRADTFSHLKIGVWVGIIMGITAFALMPFAESLTAENFFENLLKYSPASVCYILSMVIGYAGMRYLEISVISPVQNASGALSALCMVLYFVIYGKSQSDIFGSLDLLNIIGTAFIVISFISLAFVEKRLAKKEGEYNLPPEKRKYRFGAAALIFPLLYCVFDTAGTAADGIILSGASGLGLGEIDVLILYGLTFFAAGVVMWLFMLIKFKKPYNPFALRGEWPKMSAGICEEAGQIFYVYAMAQNPVIAAPLIASYCIVSCLLSRIFLKEKLKISQYICIFGVIFGIVILGVAEGISQ